ncbi:MAG: zinc ribbon domain-containing protein [bacterium]
MDFLLPGENVKITRKPNWLTLLAIAIFLIAYQNPQIGNITKIDVLILLLLFWKNTLCMITDRRILIRIDIFILRWVKAVAIEDVKGTLRLDIPFIDLVFKKTAGFIVFYTTNPLAVVCFPFIPTPREAEEIFHRFKAGLPDNEIEKQAVKETPPQGTPCPECGSLIAPDTNFCNKCGTKI